MAIAAGNDYDLEVDCTEPLFLWLKGSASLTRRNSGPGETQEQIDYLSASFRAAHAHNGDSQHDARNS